MTGKDRLIIVSNRLPVTLKSDEAGHVSIAPSSGGLASGMREWHLKSESLWVGWTGLTGDGACSELEEANAEMTRQRLIPIDLTPLEAGGYYEDFSNGVLWPLFHYLLGHIPVAEHDWNAYKSVNTKFANTIAAQYHPGDVIWVHDYHLMLLPLLLRQRLPDARIGFFLHIPFPSSEVLRILPWRAEILEGLLGADIIGFHTYGYVRHFAMSVLHILGVEPDVDRVFHGTREVRLKALPIGIDSEQFARLASSQAVQEEAQLIRDESGGRQILLGVDRLDYTKGLPRRLLALENLLSKEEWHDRIRLIQIAVPTREGVSSYRGFKREVEGLVGRINGIYGSVGSLPIHYLHRSVPLRSLVALYLAADVMVVTPLRDGLNLVAKEFIASRIENDGVLVLSEFAGAASELGEAIVVNPYDVQALSRALETALRMPQTERTARMHRLRTRVMDNSADRWADSFVNELRSIPSASISHSRMTTPEELLRRLQSKLKTGRLAIVLDYDGTMVQLQATPELATPDEELLRLIRRLAAIPQITVHLVSGRPREILDEWFKGLTIDLWAEHGFWNRAANCCKWKGLGGLPEGWKEKVKDILDHFTAATPGSSIEEKSASITWHYRLADAQFGTRQAHELRMLLGDALSNQPLEVREGKKVLEIRLRGANKCVAIHSIMASPKPPVTIIAVGDDATDEDMFAVLPALNGIGIHIGRDASHAEYSLADSKALRQWLTLLAAHKEG